MELFDNVYKIACDDIKKSVQKGSRVSVAAACFSIYAYRELRQQLKQVKDFRFLFTSPTFITEKADKQKREFYIPRLNRENSLYGTEFEIRLGNILTQKAVARECAEWIKKKATFKSNITDKTMGGFLTVETPAEQYAYIPINGFTSEGLGCKLGNNLYNLIARADAPFSQEYIKVFNEIWGKPNLVQDVTDTVLENIANAYAENAPELVYFIALYHIFHDFLEEISEDVLPDEANGFKQSKIWNMLYSFQKDAVLSIIHKLEKFNGCILADSVGLGKTFTALAVIKYYENRNKSVLVLCPRKLEENWNTYKDNYVNNPLAADRLNYDVLFHTDLSRRGGYSNGINLDRLNWGNYDLVVIDESHIFRNGSDGTRENRYTRLLNQVIRAGVKTKVLMLSATPVNNRFNDLKNQLAIAYEGDTVQMRQKIGIEKSVDEVFRQAQQNFTEWSRLPAAERTTDRLLHTLDFDFFKVLDSVTVARSRKHIEKYYRSDGMGKFPEKRKPISLRPNYTDLKKAITYPEIYEQIMSLSLVIYTPSAYIQESQKEKYNTLMHNKGSNLTQSGREHGIQRLMSVNLLKRMESSVESFRLTMQRIMQFINATILAIDEFEKGGHADLTVCEADATDFDIEDSNTDLFTVGKRVKIHLADMEYITWRKELRKDAEIFGLLDLMIADITPQHDTKLQTLLHLLDDKISHPINEGNKKVLIFSAFSDTVEYLYTHVSTYIKEKYGLDTAMITGTVDGRTTAQGLKATFNNILTCFSPLSKDKSTLLPNTPAQIDILIATDCVSEGQNLQDCDYVVNYDIHWNPSRIIQRFGRIDRIGSKNATIQLVNFWPDMELDDYINLKSRVETRMRMTIFTGTGHDNPLDPEEKSDLDYRSQQLKRMREEVANMEEMTTGVSIMDLGLNEFRSELLEYMKTHPNLPEMPKGLHAVVPAAASTPPGVIFILKNVNDAVNADGRNRLHPYYMVYIGTDGEILCDYLQPKKLLETVRTLCVGRDKPILPLCKIFNEETDDGENMKTLSQLLDGTIASILQTKEESDIESLFHEGGTSALLSQISGADDFELICFFAVK